MQMGMDCVVGFKSIENKTKTLWYDGTVYMNISCDGKNDKPKYQNKL